MIKKKVIKAENGTLTIHFKQSEYDFKDSDKEIEEAIKNTLNNKGLIEIIKRLASK